MKQDKKPVVINGLRQNCYILDYNVNPGNPIEFEEQKKYVALEEKTVANGLVQEYVEKDYPINSESVTSYMDAADYRNDPMQAIANAPQRVNLGDISEVQRFLKDDPVRATTQYAEVLRKVADYFESQKASSSTASATSSDTSSVPASEVNNA